jgi:hypothetical protein
VILYATPDDLLTGTTPWLDAEPANVDSLLRSATLLVALAAGRNPYADPAPSGAEATALRDATCAQVSAWVRGGVDPSSGGAADALPKRTEIFEAKVEYDTATQAAARAKAVKELANEATTILRVAGLLVEALPLFDATGALPSWGLSSPHAYRWPAMAEWPRW